MPPLNSSMEAHVFEICQSSERISIWVSFTWNYALNVIVEVYVSFCVIIEKTYEFLRERCEEVHNHRLSILWALLWARQRATHGAVFAARTFVSCLSHFLEQYISIPKGTESQMWHFNNPYSFHAAPFPFCTLVSFSFQTWITNLSLWHGQFTCIPFSFFYMQNALKCSIFPITRIFSWA